MTQAIVSSFPPIANTNATTLILGSMPGKASLNEQQYYAHPRNAFWPVMATIIRFDPALPYLKRIAAIQASRFAIWDVLANCIRPGSLDSAIDPKSCVANDFDAFLKQHPHIKLIAFNGVQAETLFNRLVLPNLDLSTIQRIRLPSTSPAHTMPIKEKMNTWQTALVR